MNDMIARSKQIVSHFNHSPLACSRLKEIQNELSLSQKKLIQDVATRYIKMIVSNTFCTVLLLSRLVFQLILYPVLSVFGKPFDKQVSHFSNCVCPCLFNFASTFLFLTLDGIPPIIC